MQHIILLIFGHLVFLTFVTAETYYITPSPIVTCPNENVTCLTLTKYAQQSLETVPSSNITMTFAPGNHYLGSESGLKVVNVTNLILQVEESSLSVAMVTCENSGFMFEGISVVFISGLVFNGCVNNTVKSVDKFKLEGCSFHTGHGIELERIKNATIERSSFVSLTGRETEVSRHLGMVISTAGGAIVTRNSSVVINECQFNKNTAGNGGSIYSKGCTIKINASNFSNNIVNYYGGSIYADIGTHITIQHSNFVNNTGYIHEDHTFLVASLGGVTAAFYSTVVISECHFKGNTAEFCGSIFSLNGNIKINRSSFTHNTAYLVGGTVCTFNGTNLTIQESMFISNTAHTLGGAIGITSSNIKIHNSDFTNNKVRGDGGAIYGSDRSNIEIHNSDFTNNKAGVLGGAIATNFHYGIITIHERTITRHTSPSTNNLAANITIQESTFFNNSAIQGSVLSAYKSIISLSTTNTFNNNRAYYGIIDTYAVDTNITIHYTEDMSAETYYITPTPNITCPKQNVTCLTLTEYAQQSLKTTPSSNITLTFAPGNHYLGSNLIVHYSNVRNLILQGQETNNSLFPAAMVTCNRSGFMFEGMSEISISDLEFNGCRENAVRLVDQFRLKGCRFHTGHGIELGRIKNATIERSSFVSLRYEVTICRIYWSNIEIHNSIFTNNTAYDGGAICGYSSNIKIHNSDFTSNTAHKDGGAIRTFDGKNLKIQESMFINNTAHEDGGAIATETAIITMDANTFISNSATMSGGAIYASSSNLTSRELVIKGNTAEMRGIIFAIDCSLSFLGNTTISNNYRSLYAFSSYIAFDGNTSITNNEIHGPGIQEGGALTCFQSDILFRGKVIISDNQVINGSGGAILSTESKIYTFGDTTIAKNAALSGGGIYAYQSELNFKGKTNIRGNTATEKGGGIYAVGTSIKLSGGQLQFIENTAERGGGVCLESNAKLYVIKTEGECLEDKWPCTQNTDRTRWLRLQFTNNFADYGGALYIPDNTNSGTCSANTDQSTECFFQGLALHSRSDDALNVNNMYFTGNSATKSGKTIFGGLLDRCTISTYAELFNKHQNFSPSSLNATSHLIEVTDLTAHDIRTEISSEPVRVCICNNGQPDCSYSPPPYQIKKGQTFKVSLVAVDQVNNLVPSNISAFLSSHDGGLGEGQDIQSTTSNCTELDYTVSSPHDSEQLVLYADGPCNDIGISRTIINVTFLPCNCPVGFIVSSEQSNNCVCDCDPEIDPKHITNCSIATESVQRRDNKWIYYINTSDQEGYLIHPHCPFDYCHPSTEQVWINLNVPNGADAQCAFNRSGKLCGSCEEGLSLSLGSSRCMPCSNNWLVLLIVFAIAGVALVAFLLVCNLTVAVGTISGFIFYGNILTTNHATFFPFQTHNFITVFIAWLNLDFGFVTCFYDGMDGYAKTWLQLAFSFYIIFMVAMVIIACEYSTRIARIFTKTHPVATLATLILLSYTKSLRVIIAALSSTTLEYPDGSRDIVWLTDANIHYFEGKHIPLFLVALLILLAGIAYTLFLFFYQWLLRCSYNRALYWIRSARFYPFMDAYHAPYSKKYRYWTGLLLFVRAFLYVGVALNVSGNPSINLLVFSCTMGSLLLLKLIQPARVFKSWPLDTLENSFIFNLLIFSVATLYVRETGGNQAALAYTSTSIAFITFLIILFYHTYAFVLPRKLRNKLDSIIKPKVPTVTDEDNDDTYDIKPAQENKCTFSVVDPIPPPPKTLAEVEARCKSKQMEEKPKFKCLSLENEANSPSVPTSGLNIECQVDIELEEIPADQNLKGEQNPLANGMDRECKSPTLSSFKVLVDPHIADIDQRGMERETEINDFIRVTQ